MLDLGFQRSCKYIKVLPTAFRTQPLNYHQSCKLEAHNAPEMEFFGVSGYEVEHTLSEGQGSSNLAHYRSSMPVNVSIDLEDN